MITISREEEFNGIKNSLRLMQLEKLLIISKELEFIENILDYFYGYSDEKDDGTPSKRNIKRLKEDIEVLKRYRIPSLREFNSTIQDTDLDFVLIYDYTRIEIEEMLSIIEALYTKMNQLFGEMLNQYLPYPTFFGRRYSSYGIIMLLENFFQQIFYKVNSKSTEDRLILGWNYNNDFNYKILRNRNILRENYKYTQVNDYIELPYWYYELPILIPAITHEIIALPIKKREKDYPLKSEYVRFKKTFSDFFEDNSNRLVKEIGDVLGYKWIIDELSINIFADIIAYRVHGDSYIYTLFHNLFADGIAKDFLKVIYDDDGNIIKEFSLRPNDWFFSPKREHNILRLAIMLKILEDDIERSSEPRIKRNKRIKLVKEMKSLLNLTISLDAGTKIEGFEELFINNYPNYYSTYMVVKNYLSQLYELVINDELIKNRRVRLKLSDNMEDILDIFNTLWQERFEIINRSKKSEIPCRSRFRQLIHYKISNILHLKPKLKSYERRIGSIVKF